MIRNLKVLGLALGAMLMLGAISASGASAAVEWWYKSDAGVGANTHLHAEVDPGTGPHIFTVDAGELKCEIVTAHANFTGSTQTTLTFTEVKFEKCLAFGSVPVTVDVNECDFSFHADKLTEEGTPGGKYDPETTLECPTGKEITVKVILAGVTKCTIHIPPQNFGTQITLTNVGGTPSSTEDVTADINVEGITYVQTEGTGLGKCATTSLTHNGKYTGKSTITGTNEEGKPTCIWLSPPN